LAAEAGAAGRGERAADRQSQQDGANVWEAGVHSGEKQSHTPVGVQIRPALLALCPRSEYADRVGEATFSHKRRHKTTLPQRRKQTDSTR
jgi:hypothetical protein